LKVSVVTITYNSSATVEATIKSVLSQGVEDLEYIVIDGKSKDSTLEIVNKYAGQIAKIVSEPDKGISDAFNKGIRLATGDLIILVNSDDELLPGAVKTVLAKAEEDSDVIHGNIVARDEKGYQKIKKPNCNYGLLCTKGMYLNHPGMFIRRSAYEKYGLYDLSYKCGMDRDLLARMYARGAKFQYIDKELAIFQSGGESSRHFLQHALPESRRITLQYGVSPLRTSLEIEIKKFLFIGSRIKKKLLGIIRNR